MKIFPINTYSQTNFKSKVKKVHSGTLSVGLADKIDDFEERHQNARELGSGLFAKAYLLNGTNYVIKETLPDDYARTQNRNFFTEAKALALVPMSFDNTQRLVAHAQTEKDSYYLISTFVNGETIGFPDKPWTLKSFNGLLSTLYHLDTAGIYHNDVNQSNCLVDKDEQVGMIDYQFAEHFNVGDKGTNSKEFKTPPFMMPANAQMFEMASLSYYFKTMNKNASKEEMRSTFRNYLEAKSLYARQRGMYLRGLGSYPQKEEYEMLQAKYYKNPSEDMIDLQAKKLQIMYGFRKAFSIIDPNGKADKNIASAPSSYIATAAYAKDMLNKAKQMKANTDDPSLKKFMGYEIKFGEYWRDEMIDELSIETTGGIWDWIDRNAKLSPRHDYYEDYDDYNYTCHYTDLGVSKGEDLSAKFKASENIEPESLQDIGLIISREEDSYKKPIVNNSYYAAVKNTANLLANQIALDDKAREPSTIDEQTIEYMVLKQKFIRLSKKAITAVENDNFNAVIPNAMMAQYHGKLAQQALSNLGKDKDFTDEQRKILDISLNSQIVTLSAKFLINCIKSQDKEVALDNIGDFGK